MAVHDVFSTNEVVVHVWGNGNTSGRDVLICNGLGAGPDCWPGLADSQDNGYNVYGYYHRGTSGSGKPFGDDDLYVADHAEDAFAVLDQLGLRNPLVVGWGVGVAVACELAVQHPDRVAGLLGVCGLPDTTGGVIGNPLSLPAKFSKSVAGGALSAVGNLPEPFLDVARRLSMTEATTRLVRLSGLLSDDIDPETVEKVLNHYLEHDPAWYAQLTKSAEQQEPLDLQRIHCPTRFLAAKQDVFVTPALISRMLAPLTDTHIEIVRGGHFLPIEKPQVVHAELGKLAEQTA